MKLWIHKIYVLLKFLKRLKTDMHGGVKNPVGVVTFLLLLIQQIVAKTRLTKKRRIINKNVFVQINTNFLFYKNIL